jgi:hypothetical protein
MEKRPPFPHQRERSIWRTAFVTLCRDKGDTRLYTQSEKTGFAKRSWLRSVSAITGQHPALVASQPKREIVIFARTAAGLNWEC